MSTHRLSLRLNQILICIVIILASALFLTQRELQRYKAKVAEANQISETVASPIEQTSCIATVNTRRLNQRSGPGQRYDIVDDLRRDDNVIGIAWDTSHQWLKINTATGSAWMYAPYMQLSDGCESLPTDVEFAVEPELIVNSVSDSTPTPLLETEAPLVVDDSEPTTTATLSPVFTDEVLYWSEKIIVWAETYDMDPNLIATVIQIESCGDATVNSPAGAQGLFQVMPFHFEDGEDMLDVDTNARRGLAYLQGALELADGDVGLALVGYNGGYGAISGRWALETQNYFTWGSGIYADATSGLSESSTLREWLAAGGSSLCDGAQQNLDLAQ